MAYARYFKRKGKTFGPYYYESYRDKNGKIKKRYVGTTNPDKKDDEEDFKFDEKKDLNNKTPENGFKHDSQIIPPINSDAKLLVFMIIMLVLMNALFLFFYLV